MKKVKQGFTLVELLVVIALFSLVTTSVYAAYRSTNKIYKDISNVSDLRQSANMIQKRLTEDIRKASKTVIATPTVADPTKYEFVPTDCKKFNDYCKANTYKPLLYIETLSGDKFCYAYDSASNKLLKINIVLTGSSTIYYEPISLENTYSTSYVDDSYKWIINNRLSTSSISDEIRYSGVSVYWYEGRGRHKVKHELTNFLKVGAFHGVSADYLVLKRNDVYGTWFTIEIRKIETLSESVTASESIIGEYLVNSGGGDGISIVQNISAMSNSYDVTLNFTHGSYKDELRFKASMIDYGGEIN